jgi:hypothetical protein
MMVMVRGGITPVWDERDRDEWPSSCRDQSCGPRWHYPVWGTGPATKPWSWLWPEGVQPLGMNGTGAMAVIMLGREVALPPFGDERDRDYGRRLEMAPYVQLDLGGVIDAGGQESQGDAVAEDR